MRLHEVITHYKGKSRKRVGRGGKRGTTSGRGQKGQKSRAGHRIRPALRDLILRIPKRRGFKNKPFDEKPRILNLRDIANVSEVIDRAFLKRMGILGERGRGEVKILGGGELKKPITIKGLHVSKRARAKIEKAGGKIEA